MRATAQLPCKAIARQALQRAALGALLAAGGNALAQDIVVGQIAPFAAFPEARQAHDGAKACMEQVNRLGGVRGRKLSLFAVDDELRAPLVLDKFREGMARHPIAFIDVIGGGVIGGLLESKILDTADVVIVGAIPGAEAFRQPGHPRLFHIRSGDKVHLERILLHSKTLGIRNVHVLHQDAAIGQSGLAVLQAAAQRMGGLTITASVGSTAPASLREAARQAAAAKAQAYIVIGFPPFMADALTQLRQAGVRQAVFALGYLPPALAVKVAGVEGAHGLGLTQAMPNPNGRSLPIQRDFQAAMQQSPARANDYTPFHMEGCVAVRVLVEGLRRIDGPLTPSALAKALHAMGEVDLGGFSINFGAGQVGSTWSDIGVMSKTGKLLF